MADTLDAINELIVNCFACPRLVAWREQVAREKRASFADEEYWGRPIPGFGDHEAKMLVLGLAPAAHGGNRTGRIFTGDRSGDWLFASMWRTGWANQPTSVHRDDGLAVHGAYVAAAVRCAPPANKPTTAERDRCEPYLHQELLALPTIEVVVALGAFAWDAALRAHAAVTGEPVRPKPKFGHLAEVRLDRWTLIGSFHPSQQNTFTGKLTEPMLDAVFTRARDLVAK
ncbi:MAG TPA: uracil-DNA glycosylase [Actinomycetota bacterium]|nr:uracil-DNA glycosylase [Actinomycetota bacterium]